MNSCFVGHPKRNSKFITYQYPKGFGSGDAYIEVKEDGTAICVTRLGRARPYNTQSALSEATRGTWMFITPQEAESLLNSGVAMP